MDLQSMLADRSLIESGIVRYISIVSERQSPRALISSSGTPDWYAKDAPPRRNECPTYD